MNRRFFILILSIVLAVSVLGILIVYNLEKAKVEKQRRDELEQSKKLGVSTRLMAQPGGLSEFKARLYFRTGATDPSLLLKREERKISVPADKEFLLYTLMEELIKGSTSPESFSPVPAGTALRQVFIVDDLAVVDFSGEIISHHPGGVLEEVATIYGVVNTITSNISTVRRVRILVDGIERDTLAGHVCLDTNLYPALDYVAAESTPAKASN